MLQNKLPYNFSSLSVSFFSRFRLTKKQAVILDHWGKGSPSAAETAVLDIEVGILKAYHKMMASSADLTNILENNLLKQSKLMQKIMGFFS